MNRRFLHLLLLLPWLTACQTVPKALQGTFLSLDPAEAPQLQTGTRVRWAGMLHQTRNEREQTCLVIIGLPQKASGRPKTNAEPLGRFEACAARFLDPAIYTQGRLITVTGNLESIHEETVGEYPLQVPVLRMDNHVLWPAARPSHQDTILLYDPWWPSLWFPGPAIHHHHHGHKRARPVSSPEPH